MDDKNKLPAETKEEKSRFEAVSPEDTEEAPTKLPKDRLDEVPSMADKISVERGGITERLIAISEVQNREKERLEKESRGLASKIDDLEKAYEVVNSGGVNTAHSPGVRTLLDVEHLYLFRMVECLKQQASTIREYELMGEFEELEKTLKGIGSFDRIDDGVLEVVDNYRRMKYLEEIEALKKVQVDMEMVYRKRKAELEA